MSQPPSTHGDSSKTEPVYRISFVNQNQVYELYARHLYQSDLWGFIEFEELVFGSRAGLVVDPSEEKLRNEFAGVKRTFVPMHAIIRIDEVESTGPGKIHEFRGGDKVRPFPVPTKGG
jgi:hypothetical protein